MGSLGGKRPPADPLHLLARVIIKPANKRNSGVRLRPMGRGQSHARGAGTSDQCIAPYPGDFAQALIARDADVESIGPPGCVVCRSSNSSPYAGRRPRHRDTLRPGRTHLVVLLPAHVWAQTSLFVKVRDVNLRVRGASAAVALDLVDGVVRIAHRSRWGPRRAWRAERAEEALPRKPVKQDTRASAAKAAFAGALPRQPKRLQDRATEKHAGERPAGCGRPAGLMPGWRI